MSVKSKAIRANIGKFDIKIKNYYEQRGLQQMEGKCATFIIVII